MNKEEVIDQDKLYTKCKYSPFNGFKVKGMPVTTLVRGTPVMENREIVGNPGYGKFTPPISKR